MFDIETTRIYRGSSGHKASGLGEAIDFVINYEELPIFFDGEVVRIYTGKEGGYWLHIQEKKHPERRHQFCHLSKYLVKVGDKVKQGQIVAITGGRPGDLPSAGKVTSAPHLHWELLINGKRVRPEDYRSQYSSKPKKGTSFMADITPYAVNAPFIEAFGTPATKEDVQVHGFNIPEDKRAEHITEELRSDIFDSVQYKHTAIALARAIIKRDLTSEEFEKFRKARTPISVISYQLMTGVGVKDNPYKDEKFIKQLEDLRKGIK